MEHGVMEAWNVRRGAPMRNVSRLLLIATVALLAGGQVFAQGLSESTGLGQYFNNCASCHEGTDPTAHQAPTTAALKQMTPERILDVLTTGAMRTNAANVSDQDKRLIAEWLGGRKLDTDLTGAAEKMPNQCTTHPPVRNLSAPAWNGWGVDYQNSRS